MGDDRRDPPPLRPGTPGAAGALLAAAQLALLLAVVRLYDVAERNHFFPLLAVAVGGLLVHVALPVRARLPFFGLLSVGTVLFVLGWPNGAWVVGIGAGLVALCRLPVPLAVRVAVVATAGLVLAGLRTEHPLPFWPVLGSMFMFRLIVYLFEQRHAAARPPLALTAAYFFPLPNVAFLFFPIVDFKTFRETYRPELTRESVDGGIRWVTAGLTHLLAYRVVKYYLLPAHHELVDLPHLALFLAANFALYLKVSAYFHLVTGVFHLFGFGLPRTHDNYFLASSFTDVWRRINIYWKDFLSKVVFFPAFFALRRRAGNAAAAGAAALAVFAATWALHAYQVFWITGELRLGTRDAALWLGLGVLVAVNLQLDLRRAGRPAPAGGVTAGRAVRRAVQVVGMFALVSVFWAAWNAPRELSLAASLPVRGPEVATVFGVLAAAVATGVAAQLAAAALARAGVLPLRPPPAAVGAVRAAVLAGLVVVTAPQAADLFGTRAARVLAELRRENTTLVEAARAVQGYYEEVADARPQPGAWLAGLEGRPLPPPRVTYTDMASPSDGWLERELIPGWSGDVEGARLTVNRHGMRDRPDRTRGKPPGTSRVAVVGSSIVMGWGVEDDQTFCRLVEDRLNADRPAAGPRVEVLNFGTGKSFAIHRRALLDRKVFGFDPDAVFYVAHQDEFEAPAGHLARLVSAGYRMEYPCLEEVVRRAKITPDMSPGTVEATLHPFAKDVVRGIYRDFAAACRARGVRPVWVYVPMPGIQEPPNLAAFMEGMAREGGFEVVSLDGWAAGRSPPEVKMSAIDHHANALGHRLIADRLEAELGRRPELLTAVK